MGEVLEGGGTWVRVQEVREGDLLAYPGESRPWKNRREAEECTDVRRVVEFVRAGNMRLVILEGGVSYSLRPGTMVRRVLEEAPALEDVEEVPAVVREVLEEARRVECWPDGRGGWVVHDGRTGEVLEERLTLEEARRRYPALVRCEECSGCGRTYRETAGAVAALERVPAGPCERCRHREAPAVVRERLEVNGRRYLVAGRREAPTVYVRTGGRWSAGAVEAHTAAEVLEALEARGEARR